MHVTSNNACNTYTRGTECHNQRGSFSTSCPTRIQAEVRVIGRAVRLQLCHVIVRLKWILAVCCAPRIRWEG